MCEHCYSTAFFEGLHSYLFSDIYLTSTVKLYSFLVKAALFYFNTIFLHS